MNASNTILRIEKLSKSFGALMAVSLVNDGPVTLILESPSVNA